MSDKERWYDNSSSDTGIIISSRVRLARNLNTHPFPSRLNDEGARKVMLEIADSVRLNSETGEKVFRFTDLTGIPKESLLSLCERHVISPEMVNKDGVKGYMVNADESVCVMLNEEDHARIQAVFAGDDIERAYDAADKVDNSIEEKVDYAFDGEFGYLTSCPTNAGTGLRASYMLHLPALEMTGKIKGVVQAVGKFGITVRGARGEGSDSEGGVYQLSNQTTLGKPEKEMIAALKNVTAQIMGHERNETERLLTDSRVAMEDRVYRAYGILSNARALKADEAMKLLSDVRMGWIWGILDKPRPNMTIYRVMMESRPGIVRLRAGRETAERDLDVKRADFVRERFCE